MVMVPVFTFILTGLRVRPELVVKMGVATSMAAILFTSVSSVVAHQNGAVFLRFLWPSLRLRYSLT